MNKQYSFVVIALFLIGLSGVDCFGEDLTKKTKVKFDSNAINRIDLKNMKVSDLVTGQQKGLSSEEKFILMSRMPNRFGHKTLVPISQKSGVANNGVKYFISKNPIILPVVHNGQPQLGSAANDLVVCETSLLQQASAFAGPLFQGLSVNLNQNVIKPGAIFKDEDVVRGVFTPLNLPRKPGSIYLDVFNRGQSVVQNVQNFNDQSQVIASINALLSGAGDADAMAYLSYFQAEFKAVRQLNLELETSMDVNLAPLIEIPVQVAADATGSVSTQESLNLAIAALHQIYYTISVGGEGPASTVEGNVPANAVCVTDVQYGRTAFLTVGAFSSRANASFILNELMSVGLDETITVAEAKSKLSADAKFALDAGLVKIQIVGGDVSQAVNVSNLDSLRNYVSQIEPSVSGVGAVPISYTLRYAADNATAFVGAFAEYQDRKCFRADALKVTLKNIKPTEVVDFGDEELFGSIKVNEIGKKASGDPILWKRSRSNPVSGKENQVITLNSEVTFNLNPATNSETSVDIELNLRDKIMGDPEALAATDKMKEDGFVKYVPTSSSVSLHDIRNAQNGVLNKTFLVSEGDARIELAMSFQLTKQ